MKRFTWSAPIALVLAAVVAAQTPGVHPISGRRFAPVMGYQGADWLERSERDEEEAPDVALNVLKIAKGASVADIGAGSGFITERLSARVGPTGRVFANDVQPQMLQILARRLALRKITNVTLVQGTIDDPKLDPTSVDLEIMVDVYHELEYPYEMLAAIVRALKPGGRVVFVEFRGDDPSVPIKALHTMTEDQVRKEAAVHPLVWIKTVSDLPWQHVVVFRKK